MNITMIDYMKKESLKILVVGRLMNCKQVLVTRKTCFFRFDPVFYPEQYSLYYLVLSFLLPFIFKTSAGMFYSL